MLFKVYARNCSCAKRISEVTEKDLRNVIDDVLDLALEHGILDITSNNDPDEIDDVKEQQAYKKIWDYWNEYKHISAGDYEIVEKESIFDVQVPNVCYGDDSIIF